MAITTAVCNSYKQEILQGIHLAADTYKIALIKTSPAGTFGAATTNYSDLSTDEASGTGYSAGGATLSGFTTGLSSGTAYIDFTVDPSWSSASITAGGALIYNSSRSNKAVAVYAFTNDPVTSTNGTFSIPLPAPGATALIRIA